MFSHISSTNPGVSFYSFIALHGRHLKPSYSLRQIWPTPSSEPLHSYVHRLCPSTCIVAWNVKAEGGVPSTWTRTHRCVPIRPANATTFPKGDAIRYNAKTFVVLRWGRGTPGQVLKIRLVAKTRRDPLSNLEGCLLPYISCKESALMARTHSRCQGLACQYAGISSRTSVVSKSHLQLHSVRLGYGENWVISHQNRLAYHY